MARKTEIVRVPAGYGRDYEPKQKVFLITEWPAERAEDWALRAIIAYNRGGGQIDPAAIGGGMEAIFWLGMNTFLRGTMQAGEVIPIFKELLECVKIIRDPNAKDVSTGLPLATDIFSPDDIEEVKTRLWLRSEVLRVHTGFSPAAAISDLISAVMTKVSSTQQTSPP